VTISPCAVGLPAAIFPSLVRFKELELETEEEEETFYRGLFRFYCTKFVHMSKG